MGIVNKRIDRRDHLHRLPPLRHPDRYRPETQETRRILEIPDSPEHQEQVPAPHTPPRQQTPEQEEPQGPRRRRGQGHLPGLPGGRAARGHSEDNARWAKETREKDHFGRVAFGLEFEHSFRWE